jgi:hypothetical protein
MSWRLEYRQQELLCAHQVHHHVLPLRPRCTCKYSHPFVCRYNGFMHVFLRGAQLCRMRGNCSGPERWWTRTGWSLRCDVSFYPAVPVTQLQSVLISMFSMLIAVAAYLIGGCAYQRTVMHQRGWRQCPNFSLWAGMFDFIKVCLLALVPCRSRRRFRYGNVASHKYRESSTPGLPISRLD